MTPLTDRQAEVLGFVALSWDTIDQSPTVRMIAARLDVPSPNAALDHLRALERKGWLLRRCRTPNAVTAWLPVRYPDGRPFLTRQQLMARIDEIEDGGS